VSRTVWWFVRVFFFGVILYDFTLLSCVFGFLSPQSLSFLLSFCFYVHVLTVHHFLPQNKRVSDVAFNPLLFSYTLPAPAFWVAGQTLDGFSENSPPRDSIRASKQVLVFFVISLVLPFGRCAFVKYTLAIGPLQDDDDRSPYLHFLPKL